MQNYFPIDWNVRTKRFSQASFGNEIIIAFKNLNPPTIIVGAHKQINLDLQRSVTVTHANYLTYIESCTKQKKKKEI